MRCEVLRDLKALHGDILKGDICEAEVYLNAASGNEFAKVKKGNCIITARVEDNIRIIEEENKSE